MNLALDHAIKFQEDTATILRRTVDKVKIDIQQLPDEEYRFVEYSDLPSGIHLKCTTDPNVIDAWDMHLDGRHQ